ncbi:MAG TPA: efflux RND transporter periplasmic adaptor subunit [Acidobacteriaceae bacterium]|nr:efflux RND transporter periplasmic adaptor subunit [Acidobacteriaceae bacterium]
MEQKPPVSSSSPDRTSTAYANNTGSPERKKRRQWLWILILLLIFAGIFYLVLRKSGNQQAAHGPGASRMFSGPVTLTAATAKVGDIGVYINNIGTVTPIYTATIYNQVTGVVTAVYYREGQMVRKGEPLVEIDPRQYQANVDAAAGNLERDTNLLAQAKMDLARYQDAWARNAIARQTLEDQEKVVLQDEGLVQADKGALEFDKVQLSYCHIVAPFTGKVGLRLIDPGNLVQASSSTPLVVVTQMEPTTVVFTLAENDLEKVLKQRRAGHRLTVEAWNASQTQKLGTGLLTALDNQIDTTTGTLKLRATFANRQDLLYPNQFVNTRLLVDTEKNQTLVPSQAIQHNGQEAFVFLIVNGKKPNEKIAKMQDVKPDTTNEGMTAVTGINPGDMVATSSFEKLRNGSEVHIAKTAPQSSNNESNAP